MFASYKTIQHTEMTKRDDDAYLLDTWNIKELSKDKEARGRSGVLDEFCGGSALSRL